MGLYRFIFIVFVSHFMLNGCLNKAKIEYKAANNNLTIGGSSNTSFILGINNYFFNSQRALFSTSDNSIYVADRDNHRILKLNGSGDFVSSFGINGTNDGELSSPEGLYVDETGNIFVADTGNDRI